MYTFHSEIGFGEKLPNFTDTEVKNEPMFFQSDLDFALKNGGPITHAFLSALCKIEEFSKNEIVFDSRSHMLMEHWFPCIPGYHHDSIIRSRNGQPNYDVENLATHCMCLINGDVCPTEFALGSSSFDKVPDGEIVYKTWHKEVERQLNEGILKRFTAPSNQLIFFDWQTWHQGTQAVKFGWRWFGRLNLR